MSFPILIGFLGFIIRKCNACPTVSSKALFQRSGFYSNTQMQCPWSVFWCAAVWVLFTLRGSSQTVLLWFVSARLETTAGLCSLWGITAFSTHPEQRLGTSSASCLALLLDFSSAEETAKLFWPGTFQDVWLRCGWNKYSSKIFVVPLSLLFRSAVLLLGQWQ